MLRLLYLAFFIVLMIVVRSVIVVVIVCGSGFCLGRLGFIQHLSQFSLASFDVNGMTIVLRCTRSGTVHFVCTAGLVRRNRRLS